jgi:serine/threonine-protein kinase
VAIKVLGDRYADDESVRERFKREALAAARLSGSPNTVTIFDVGDSGGHPYIVMELLEGGTLEDRLKAGGAQDPADVVRWLDQASSALDAAHAAGVVHRDVKPGNLLLNSRGEVAVADFGVASAVGLDSMTMTGTVLGTAGYLSPEQAKGERATPASDRCRHRLLGAAPFASKLRRRPHVHARSVPSQHGDVPPELDPCSAVARIAGRYRARRLRGGVARGALAHRRRDAGLAPATPPPGAASTRLGGCGDPRPQPLAQASAAGVWATECRPTVVGPDDELGDSRRPFADGHDGSGDDERDYGRPAAPPTPAGRS